MSSAPDSRRVKPCTTGLAGAVDNSALDRHARSAGEGAMTPRIHRILGSAVPANEIGEGGVTSSASSRQVRQCLPFALPLPRPFLSLLPLLLSSLLLLLLSSSL